MKLFFFYFYFAQLAKSEMSKFNVNEFINDYRQNYRNYSYYETYNLFKPNISALIEAISEPQLKEEFKSAWEFLEWDFLENEGFSYKRRLDELMSVINKLEL